MCYTVNLALYRKLIQCWRYIGTGFSFVRLYQLQINSSYQASWKHLVYRTTVIIINVSSLMEVRGYRHKQRNPHKAKHAWNTYNTTVIRNYNYITFIWHLWGTHQEQRITTSSSCYNSHSHRHNGAMKVDILLGISYRIGRKVTGDNLWLNNTRLSTKYIKARFTVATTHHNCEAATFHLPSCVRSDPHNSL